MTTKNDFSSTEWDTLLSGILATNIYIIVADPSIFGSIKEAIAFSKNIVETLAQPDTDELLRYLLSDLQDKDTVKRLTPELKGDPAIIKQVLQTHIKDAVALLNEKATPEEALQIRQWMYDLADRTASAAREGGFLGIGAVRVSEQEKRALAELAQILGVNNKETEAADSTESTEAETQAEEESDGA